MKGAHDTTVVPARLRDVADRATRSHARAPLNPPQARANRKDGVSTTAGPQAFSPMSSRVRGFRLLGADLMGLALLAIALCLIGSAPLFPPLYWLHGFSQGVQGLLGPAVLVITAVVIATRLREYRQLVSRLSDSEARYRILAEGSSDIVLLIDGAGLCLSISPSAEDLVDHSSEALIGHPVCDYIHPEDLAAVGEAQQLARRHPGSSSALVHRVRHRSGTWIWCETRIRVQANTHAGFVCAIRDISEQHAREAVLLHRASIDSLTGLLNRDSLKQCLDAAIIDARREQQSLALVLFDIDHFKNINDAHGHPTGDRVLQAIGEACVQAVRVTDHAGRIGGEEFALVLPGATIAAAADACTRLRRNISSTPVLDALGQPIQVTISAGIAVLGVWMTEDDFTAAADRALYAAKNAGRDCAFASVGDQFIRAL